MFPPAFGLDLIALLACALYLAAAGALARPMLSEGAAPKRAALAAGTLAVILHFAVLLGAHRGALDLHFFAALSVVAAVIAALTLIVNLARPVAALGVIVFPLAAMLLAIDQFLAPPTAPLALDWQIKLHVTLALIAFGLLAIAALLALLLAMQERALRARRLSGWLRVLPPLTLTESLMFRLIAAGFVLLTLALLSGVLFVHNLFTQDLVQKTVLSVLAWIVFGVLLIGRAAWGWRGRRAIYLTLAGMAVLLLAFFGSKFVLEMVLHRGI
ncbi:MAG TPA: cytochrome c biogenesis protein CcsA [Rhodanobacteraceae bacterium]|nr:cytochrome c biogenesis protein CcsA [Rhodanobacteraceae bacterium]